MHNAHRGIRFRHLFQRMHRNGGLAHSRRAAQHQVQTWPREMCANVRNESSAPVKALGTIKCSRPPYRSAHAVPRREAPISRNAVSSFVRSTASPSSERYTILRSPWRAHLFSKNRASPTPATTTWRSSSMKLMCPIIHDPRPSPKRTSRVEQPALPHFAARLGASCSGRRMPTVVLRELLGRWALTVLLCFGALPFGSKASLLRAPRGFRRATRGRIRC